MEVEIEKFLILAKGQGAKALEDVIDKVLQNPQIFVFAEFIDLTKKTPVSLLPKVNSSLKVNAKLAATLDLFAYGTYPEYLQNKEKYIELKPAHISKLKLITLVDLASKSAKVSY